MEDHTSTFDVDSIPLHDADTATAKQSLICAATQLSARGLDHSASWALDLAECLPDEALEASDDSEGTKSRSQFAPHCAVSSPWLLPFKSALSASTPAKSAQYPPSGQPSTSATPAYPMQSTPFLGVVAPSSSSIHSSSPLRPLSHPASHSVERQSANLAVDQGLHNIPGQSDLSGSGRFPAPFRQPPSPLANLSYSAEGEDSMQHPGKPSSNSTGKAGLHASDPDDDSMQEDNENRVRDGVSSARMDAHPTHVRFALESAASRSQSCLDDGPFAPENLQSPEAASYDLALSCFRTGQLHRCKFVLERSLDKLKLHHGRPEGSRSTFLRLYAGMLLCEADSERAQEDSGAFGLISSSTSTSLQPLISLLRDLVNPSDPFLLFLKGIILRKLKKRVEAMDCLIRSLLLFPYNWTAWLEFNAVLDTSSGELEEVESLLPKSFMTLFWREYCERQTAAGKDPEFNIGRIERLLGIFPDNAGLWNALGSTRYMQQDFLASIDAFERALDIDPFRAEGLADYSNALFLLERSDKLSELAHTVSSWGSSHPEVCCVIGNHFYYQADHVRAIEAFKKAIKLDPGCVAAWILLGHAFIEMKNAGAASEMYRRAIDIHPRDYRPWHGLGKVYELLEGWSFSVYYYLKAAVIAPYTATIWSSLGHVYTRLGQYRNAISAHQRHLSCESGRNGGTGDVTSQLSSISAILSLLERYMVEADMALDKAGAQDVREEDCKASVQQATATARGKTVARLQLHRSDLEQESIDWHCRAVALLLQSTSERRASWGQARDSTEPEDGSGDQLPSLAPEDVQVWAESFVKSARSVAGLPPDFDPDQPGTVAAAAAGLPHDHDATEWLAERGNAALAHEYLSRLLAATASLGNTGARHGSGHAFEEMPDPPFAASGPERWRYEAAKLLKWLHAVKAL